MINRNNLKKLNMELKVIELCAGIGQTSLALQQACNTLNIKMTIEAFCEIDSDAIKAYKILHPRVNKLFNDIRTACFKGMYCDILLATTPCQGFSALGKKQGFKEVEGNESCVIWNTFRIIDELEMKPKIIFFENVKGMISEKNQTDFKIFENELKRRGYKVSYKVLDAQNFNVPQHRERVYIIATLDKIAFEFPREETLTIFLKDILEKNYDSKFLMPSTFNEQIIKTNKRGRNVRVHNPSFAKVSFTLTTKSRGQDNNNYIFCEDMTKDSVVRFTPKNKNAYRKIKRIRSLTRLEQGRLMGMKDDDIHKLDYICDTKFSKMMGNGVVINVVEKILKNVLEAYIEQYNNLCVVDINKKVA